MSERSYSREFKLRACEQIVNGEKTKADIYRTYALSPGMVDRWVDQFKVLGINAFPRSGSLSPSQHPRRIKILEIQVKKLILDVEQLQAQIDKLESSKPNQPKPPSTG